LPSHGYDAPLTALLRRVLRAIARRARVLPEGGSALVSADGAIALAVKAYYTNSGPDQATGLCQRLRGKSGLLRQNLMGWRVNSCARAVIAPDPALAPWEVGVPGAIAHVLKLREGDTVVLNRQPSLHRGSMMGHIVRMRPADYCLSISPTVTVPYNADFDGDEMNLHTTSAESRADARFLMGVEHNVLSAANGTPCVRLVQDGCLARYLTSGLTAHDQKSELVELCEQDGQAGAAQRLHVQQLAAFEYMSGRGFSVGVDDFLPTVPYEGADRHTLGRIAAGIAARVPATNRVGQMVAAGSKGSLMNLVQLFA